MRAVQSSQKRNRTHRVVESRGIASSVVFGSQFNGGFDTGKGYLPPPSRVPVTGTLRARLNSLEADLAMHLLC